MTRRAWWLWMLGTSTAYNIVTIAVGVPFGWRLVGAGVLGGVVGLWLELRRRPA